MDNKNKKEAIKNTKENKNKKENLSIGISFLSIFLIVLGIFSAISISNQFTFPGLFWSILYILSGFGLLFRKFWGFRLTQIALILPIIVAPFSLVSILYNFNEESATQLISLLIITGLSVGLLYYLSKPKNIKQFLSTTDDNELKEKASLAPIFSGITLVITIIGQLILLGIMISYLFDWMGGWAYLVLVGGAIGIPFLSLIFSILLFTPFFLIIFWFVVGSFPFWILIIWVVSFLAQIGHGYLNSLYK